MTYSATADPRSSRRTSRATSAADAVHGALEHRLQLVLGHCPEHRDETGGHERDEDPPGDVAALPAATRVDDEARGRELRPEEGAMEEVHGGGPFRGVTS
ncbi:hypothetical protein N801_13705 [Knoellia aerolata DSM 18566]|uniref:Uncharacterized protein n=1 Tax=Knoellia aerolata DSM 18566 TaxID=1385519 RepID=A0A0A0K2Z7_9MICO|nr:hypothetical protein N801_13705 [Knoellia aerolata DSM 18566]